MKKYILSIAAISIMLFFACEKEDGKVLELVTEPVLEELSVNDFTFNDESAKDKVTFKWTKAEYNIPTEAKYVLLVDKKGGDFSNAIEVVATAETSVEVNVLTLNKLMTLSFNIPVDSIGKVDFKVASRAGVSSINMAISNSIELRAKTYLPPYTPETFKIMVDGEELKEFELIENEEKEGYYEGYVYISDANSEIILKGGDEQAAEYGYTGSGTPEGDGPKAQRLIYDLLENGDPIKLDSAGYWQIRFDMNTKEVGIMGTAWGVIGSGIPPYDWTKSQDMEYDEAKDIWKITVETHDGKFKFRPNSTWDPLNYGASDKDDIPGEYGADLPIGAGTKTITLDLSKYPYSYKVE